MVGRNMSLKNPVTSPGINPGTLRLVAQRLNHYATPVPKTMVSTIVLYYNLMGPPSFMRSVVDRNVVMRSIPVVSSGRVGFLAVTWFV
jgi:hypothetical protein